MGVGSTVLGTIMTYVFLYDTDIHTAIILRPNPYDLPNGWKISKMILQIICFLASFLPVLLPVFFKDNRIIYKIALPSFVLYIVILFEAYIELYYPSEASSLLMTIYYIRGLILCIVFVSYGYYAIIFNKYSPSSNGQQFQQNLNNGYQGNTEAQISYQQDLSNQAQPEVYANIPQPQTVSDPLDPYHAPTNMNQDPTDPMFEPQLQQVPENTGISSTAQETEEIPLDQ